ncbi:MAG: C-GCAxxG-C-C family protein [Eubacteriales bacterium]
MNYKKEISPSKIRQDASGLYGQYFCSEAIVSAIVDNLEVDIPKEALIAMSSGFPVGLGGSRCLCGAVSGGVMTLGLFFGRSTPGDDKIGKMMELSAELHDWFKVESKKNSLCCRVITHGIEWQSQDHFNQCAWLTGLVAERVAQVLIRELDLTDLDQVVAS